MNSSSGPPSMRTGSRPRRFSAPAIILHWAVAALLLANFYLGLNYEGAHGLARFTVLQLHKSLGFTVLALSLVRLGFRVFGGAPPAHPETMKRWEKAAATAVHWSFYVLMLVLPLSGWIIVSASPTNIPTLLYKTVPVPHLGFIHALAMPVRKSLAGGTTETHLVLAWIMIALFVLHAAAALKHYFWDKDFVLYQMVPFLRPRRD